MRSASQAIQLFQWACLCSACFLLSHCIYFGKLPCQSKADCKSGEQCIGAVCQAPQFLPDSSSIGERLSQAEPPEETGEKAPFHDTQPAKEMSYPTEMPAVENGQHKDSGSGSSCPILCETQNDCNDCRFGKNKPFCYRRNSKASKGICTTACRNIEDCGAFASPMCKNVPIIGGVCVQSCTQNSSCPPGLTCQKDSTQNTYCSP